MNWSLLWLQVWPSPFSKPLRTGTHTHTPFLFDGKLHLSCGLLLCQLSVVLRQTVICSTVFVYCLLHHGTFHRSPLLLQLICVEMQPQKATGETESECSYVANQSTQAVGGRKKRIFYICLFRVCVSLCLRCVVCHFSVTCDRWVGRLLYLGTSRPHHRHTSWASLSRWNWFTSHLCCWCCQWGVTHTRTHFVCLSPHKGP